jgi:hypothetical protein
MPESISDVRFETGVKGIDIRFHPPGKVFESSELVPKPPTGIDLTESEALLLIVITAP